MSDIGQALRDATVRLDEVSDTPRLDAELLLAHALGLDRAQLLLDHSRYHVPASFDALIERRLGHEPIAYILGYRDFWTIRLKVGPGVLIPRPDSETLIEAALGHFAGQAPRRVLDLGVGPGTLLLAALAEWPAASGLGVDASETALCYARDNAAALGMQSRVELRQGNWTAGLCGKFDLILCNPPYIGEDEELMLDVADHEPPEALYAGQDGLEDYRRIIPELPRLLSPGGAAILEIGAAQLISVSALAEKAGLQPSCRRDLAGRDRALLLTRN